MLGQNISMLMKKDVAAYHDTYLRRYMSTKQAHVVGSQREVDALTKKNQVR